MSGKSWSCIIHGDPVGQGRPRFSRRRDGVHTYNPERSEAWRSVAVETMCCHWDGGPIDAPCTVEVRAVLQRPKRLMRRCDPEWRLPCPCKPDVDNVAKAVLDALTEAKVLSDDARVVRLVVTKHYTAMDEGPRVEVDVAYDSTSTTKRDAA